MATSTKSQNYPGVNLRVDNLDASIDNAGLFKWFSPYGKIFFARVMVDEHGKSKGYGFVCFSKLDEAEKAIEGFKRQMIVLKYVQISFTPAPVNLYIKNLDATIDDKRLREIFTPFGEITSVKVMMEDGKSKGFGFVCFFNREQANKAIEGMNGKLIGSKKLYVGFAERKEDRKRDLTSNYIERMQQMRANQFKQFTRPQFQFGCGLFLGDKNLKCGSGSSQQLMPAFSAGISTSIEQRMKENQCRILALHQRYCGYCKIKEVSKNQS